MKPNEDEPVCFVVFPLIFYILHHQYLLYANQAGVPVEVQIAVLPLLILIWFFDTS